MKVTFTPCSIVKLYIPLDSNVVDLEAALLRLANGYTCLGGWGTWMDLDDRKIEEEVIVYECAVSLTEFRPPQIEAVVELIGRYFLQDNPKEQAFLATVDNLSIYIERN